MGSNKVCSTGLDNHTVSTLTEQAGRRLFEVANLDRAGGAQNGSLMFEVAGFD